MIINLVNKNGFVFYFELVVWNFFKKILLFYIVFYYFYVYLFIIFDLIQLNLRPLILDFFQIDMLVDSQNIGFCNHFFFHVNLCTYYDVFHDGVIGQRS